MMPACRGKNIEIFGRKRLKEYNKIVEQIAQYILQAVLGT
jgi:hypothetical protein